MITTKLLNRPGTDYFLSTVPKAVGEYLQLRQGDFLVWEFDGAEINKRRITGRKITCIRKGNSAELDGTEVEE